MEERQLTETGVLELVNFYRIRVRVRVRVSVRV